MFQNLFLKSFAFDDAKKPFRLLASLYSMSFSLFATSYLVKGSVNNYDGTAAKTIFVLFKIINVSHLV